MNFIDPNRTYNTFLCWCLDSCFLSIMSWKVLSRPAHRSTWRFSRGNWAGLLSWRRLIWTASRAHSFQHWTVYNITIKLMLILFSNLKRFSDSFKNSRISEIFFPSLYLTKVLTPVACPFDPLCGVNYVEAQNYYYHITYLIFTRWMKNTTRTETAGQFLQGASFSFDSNKPTECHLLL